MSLRLAPGRHVGAACLAMLILTACATRPPPASPGPESPPAPPPPHPGLTVAAVGDVMLGTDFPENILPDDDGVGFLDAVTPLLSAPDVTFGNLEGVLLDGGEPVKQCRNKRACFLFRSPTRYAAYLAKAGFDVMSLANNHARDFGEEGRTSSMEALDAVGIHHSGREGTFASWTVKGQRIGFVAFAPNVGANLLNDPDVARQRVEAMATSHDIIIVSFHGGAEGDGAEVLPFGPETYAGEDRGNVVAFAHLMIDAGADLVLGHGPHVVRALELYQDRLIAYSLGNFATYYGISVEGNRGIAPILLATLDGEGRFVAGRIEATTQIRPAGPSLDPSKSVVTLLHALTASAFPDGKLSLGEDGALLRREPLPSSSGGMP